MDTSTPVTAAQFEAVGVDPVSAATLAQQANIMAGRGSFNDRVALSNELESMAPAPKATPPPATTNAQLADATVQHQELQLEGQMDATFGPPANAFDYRFPESTEPVTDEQLAVDSDIKNAMHAAQMPKFVVESIAANLATASRTLANETPAQAQARIESQKTRLQGMWGKDFDGNMAVVDTFLEQQSAKSPALKAFIQNAARVFTPLDIDLLLQVAKHRASKR